MFARHPRFAGPEPRFWFQEFAAGEGRDLAWARMRPTLEGGDVLVLSAEVLVIGYSERTEKTTIERLAEALRREKSLVRKILVVAIPPQRATMHLDTVFTRISSGECLCYGPMILSGGAEEADVYEADLTSKEITWTTKDDLLSSLSALGIDLAPILCGGLDPIDQQREQWTDGANAFALAPGVILCYDRNERTAETLSRHGYTVVADDDLLLGTRDPGPPEARQARDSPVGARAVARPGRPALHDDAARARSGIERTFMFQKDLISIHDLSASDVAALFTLAAGMKARPRDFRATLSGKILAMIFEKSSTRTRVSFEAGMTQLGGAAQFLSARDIQIGRGEPIADTARVLSRYVDGIMARTFAHDTVVQLARHATIPVINGLTDLLHPCQALTDYFTMSEKFGSLAGLRLAYVGDGNNMAHSLMYGGPKCGVHVAVATPAGYEPDASVTGERARGRGGGGNDPPRDAFPGRGGGGRPRRLHRRVGIDGPGGRAAETRARTRAPGARSRGRAGGAPTTWTA